MTAWRRCDSSEALPALRLISLPPVLFRALMEAARVLSAKESSTSARPSGQEVSPEVEYRQTESALPLTWQEEKESETSILSPMRISPSVSGPRTGIGAIPERVPLNMPFFSSKSPARLRPSVPNLFWPVQSTPINRDSVSECGQFNGYGIGSLNGHRAIAIRCPKGASRAVHEPAP